MDGLFEILVKRKTIRYTRLASEIKPGFIIKIDGVRRVVKGISDKGSKMRIETSGRKVVRFWKSTLVPVFGNKEGV